MCGTGYRSGVAALFKHWKSQHGLQPPDDLGTMCRGEDHWLLERRMMPISSIFWNSSLAICNLSGGSRRARACTGGPLVVMNSCTPCLGEGLVNEGVVMS